jgi:hypothetical protein
LPSPRLPASTASASVPTSPIHSESMRRRPVGERSGARGSRLTQRQTLYSRWQRRESSSVADHGALPEPAAFARVARRAGVRTPRASPRSRRVVAPSAARPVRRGRSSKRGQRLASHRLRSVKIRAGRATSQGRCPRRRAGRSSEAARGDEAGSSCQSDLELRAAAAFARELTGRSNRCVVVDQDRALGPAGVGERCRGCRRSARRCPAGRRGRPRAAARRGRSAGARRARSLAAPGRPQRLGSRELHVRRRGAPRPGIRCASAMASKRRLAFAGVRGPPKPAIVARTRFRPARPRRRAPRADRASDTLPSEGHPSTGPALANVRPGARAARRPAPSGARAISRPSRPVSVRLGVRRIGHARRPPSARRSPLAPIELASSRRVLDRRARSADSAPRRTCSACEPVEPGRRAGRSAESSRARCRGRARDGAHMAPARTAATRAARGARTGTSGRSSPTSLLVDREVEPSDGVGAEV